MNASVDGRLTNTKQPIFKMNITVSGLNTLFFITAFFELAIVMAQNHNEK